MRWWRWLFGTTVVPGCAYEMQGRMVVVEEVGMWSAGNGVDHRLYGVWWVDYRFADEGTRYRLDLPTFSRSADPVAP